MAKKMKVLKVEPNKDPVLVEINNDLKDLQDAVDGYIECIYPFDDDVAIVCNEDGKINRLTPNRVLRDNGKVYDVLCGTFLIVGLTAHDFKSLSEEQAKEYTEVFKAKESLVPNGLIFW